MNHFCSADSNGTYTISWRLGEIIYEYRGVCLPEGVPEVPELAFNDHSSTLRYRHCPSYAIVAFQKVRRKSEFSHVRPTYTCGQLYMYVQGIKLKSKLQHTETWPAAARPSRCLSVFFRYLQSHWAFIPARKNTVPVSKVLFQSFYFLKKLHKPEIA
jgi:hypothetical protein